MDLVISKVLASRFTVVSYDRRGRGKSTDTAPYSPEQEIEDLAALVDAVGSPVFLYGHASGAALALEASVKLGKRVPAGQTHGVKPKILAPVLEEFYVSTRAVRTARNPKARGVAEVAS